MRKFAFIRKAAKSIFFIVLTRVKQSGFLTEAAQYIQYITFAAGMSILILSNIRPFFL